MWSDAAIFLFNLFGNLPRQHAIKFLPLYHVKADGCHVRISLMPLCFEVVGALLQDGIQRQSYLLALWWWDGTIR
jgi:hypothetical protein